MSTPFLSALLMFSSPFHPRSPVQAPSHPCFLAFIPSTPSLSDVVPVRSLTFNSLFHPFVSLPPSLSLSLSLHLPFLSSTFLLHVISPPSPYFPVVPVFSSSILYIEKIRVSSSILSVHHFMSSLSYFLPPSLFPCCLASYISSLLSLIFHINFLSSSSSLWIIRLSLSSDPILVLN